MIEISAFWLGVTLWIGFTLLGLILYKKTECDLAILGLTITITTNIFSIPLYSIFFFSTCNCVRLV